MQEAAPLAVFRTLSPILIIVCALLQVEIHGIPEVAPLFRAENDR